jgi:CubicO group peptidase (beta-lactamase class C family)
MRSTEDIRAATEARVKARRTVGLAVGVEGDSGRSVACAGLKHIGERAPITRDTLFEIGSITKLFTALLLQDSALRGELELTQPINDFLPAKTQAPAFGGQPIRLIDLATHVAGLPSFMDTPPFDEAWAGRYGIAEMLVDVAGFTLTQPIGSTWKYSNTGYGLIGLALERATGAGYEALLRERVLDPLGMVSTAITLTPELQARAATPHSADQSQTVAHIAIPPMLAAGALWSTADDLLTFLAAAGGRTKSALKPAFDAMLTYRAPASPPPGPIPMRQALGWLVIEGEAGVLAGHSGGTIGMASMALLDTGSGDAVVVLGNAVSSHATFAVSLLWPDTPLEEPAIPEPHEAIALDRSVLARLTGRYEVAPGVESLVEADAEGLILRPPDGPRLRLRPYAENAFFNPAHGFTVVFELPDAGPATAITLTAAGVPTTTAKRPLADAPIASRETRADAIIAEAMRAGPIPGVSVAIEQDGKNVYQKGFGYADLERQIPVTQETRFPVGSITKSFTGLAVMQLVNAGKVDLDRPAGVYLPDLPEPDRSVSVHHLLNHTSGIPNYTDLPNFPMANPVGMTRQQVIAYFDTLPLQFPSGTRFSYTNSGAYLLGLIVESASGQSYDRYVIDHVLTPFGMTETGFDAHDDGATNRARGYKLTADGFRPAPLYDFEVPFSAGAIVSTSGDLLKYRGGVFGPATSPAVRKLILRHVALPNQPNPYALGCLIETNFEGHRKITHSGDIFGFAADFAYYPDDDLTIAILTNTQSAAFPPLTIEHKLARVFLGLPAPRLVDLPIPADLGARLSGDYEVGAVRFGFDTLRLVHKDGQLALSVGGVTSGAPLLPLRYQGDGRFVSAVDDEHVLIFKPELDGSVDLDMLYYDGSTTATKPAPKS